MHWGEITGIVFGVVFGYALLGAVAVRVFPLRGKEAAAKKRKEMIDFPVKRVAHRGGSLLGQENTIYTFRKGVQDHGVEVLELDVAESADGIPIVVHDMQLDRLCGTEENVSTLRVGGVDETEKENLPMLQKDIRLHFPSRSQDTYHTDHPPQRLCTLREVFSAFPTTPIHLDCKMPSASLVRTTIAMIEEFRRERITILGSGTTVNTKVIIEELEKPSRQAVANAQMGPEGTLVSRPKRKELIPTFPSFSEVLKIYLFYYLGVLPLVPLRISCMSIPYPSKAKKEFIKRVTGSAWKAWLASFLMNAPAMWTHLQRRGITILFWVLNDADEFEEALAAGGDGIMTDDPKLLDDYLNEHNV